MATLIDTFATRLVQAIGILAVFGIVIYMVNFNDRKPHAMFDPEARFSYNDHLALQERYPDGKFLDAHVFVACVNGGFVYFFADRTQTQWTPPGFSCWIP